MITGLEPATWELRAPRSTLELYHRQFTPGKN
jgi:hypothetical protein